MKSSADTGRESAPLTPRRRGVAGQPPQKRGSAPFPVNNTAAHEETPILLRLPDLHPSPAVDAAVRRIEKQTAKKSPPQPPSGARKNRSEIRLTTEQPPLPPAAAKVRTAVTDWNNRIILTTFVLALVASAVMVIQRAARDRADANDTSAPLSATDDFDPVPSRRINRPSFQADSRSSDVGEPSHKQSSHRTSSTARIGTYSESESAYDAMLVSYEDQQPAAGFRGNPSEDPMIDTYDLSIRGADEHDHDLYQPRTLRLREEHPQR